MMGEMPEWLFIWWQQFFDEVPFGPETDNLMRARICRTITVQHRDTSDAEFMPGRRVQTDDEEE